MYSRFHMKILKSSLGMAVFAIVLNFSTIDAGGQSEDTELTLSQYFSRISSAVYAKDRTKALEIAEKAARQYPERPEPFYFRGRIEDTFRHFDESLKYIESGLGKDADFADLWQLKGIVEFQLARPGDSAASFDQYLSLRPAQTPYHWQRGISYYYAGEFRKGVEQFKVHESVNATDVENIFWHFLCNSRVIGPEKARQSLLPLKPGDTRIPMKQIYGLLRGTHTPAEVIQAATDESGGNNIFLKNHLCYAHLYLGLYWEALGEKEKAFIHIEKAANEFRQEHYMGDVARVHYILLKKQRDSLDMKNKASEKNTPHVSDSDPVKP